MGDPKSLFESARLLEIAAGKGDAGGHLTLGLHLLEGILGASVRVDTSLGRSTPQ